MAKQCSTKQCNESYNIQIPQTYLWLFDKARYKVCYGGRGAGRSWNFARYMIAQAMSDKKRILCTREIQSSIRDSVHATLKDQIEQLGLSKYFDIKDKTIICLRTGSEFIFSGLYRNINKIKSLEGIDICDVEEAENVSEESWSKLLPTIRKEGSEILIRFNTNYPDDPTYQRFIETNQPNSIVKLTTYQDNPCFPDTLNEQRLADKAYKPLDYPNIWEGKLKGYGRKVWQDFDEKIHVKDFDWENIKDTANCYMAIDPAMHYYSFGLWCAVFPIPGNEKETLKWIYAEYPTRDQVHDDFHVIRKKLLFTGTLSDISRDFLVKDGTQLYGNKIIKRGIDTRFTTGTGSGSYFSGDTQGLVSEYAKRENGGLLFSQPNVGIIDVQRDVIRSDLTYNHLINISSYNQPKLYISPRCKNLILSLNNHRLEEDKEKESERYKDASDTLRILYATMHNLKYRDPRPNNTTYQGFSTSSGLDFRGSGNMGSGGWLGN